VEHLPIPSPRWWPPRGVYADRLYAAVAAVVTVVDVVVGGFQPVAPTVAMGIAMCVPLAWRRIHPLPVLGAVMAASLLLNLIEVANSDLLVFALAHPPAVYSVAAFLPRREAVVGLAVAASTAFVSIVLTDNITVSDFVWASLVVGALWGVGRVMRARVLEVSRIAEHAVRLEVERERQAVAAVGEERSRIARELHDIVSHGLSVMVIQAAAADAALEDDPALARQALASVQDVGREAQVEMVRMLGLLRGAEHDDQIAPQPGLHDIRALVDRVRAAGVPVELREEGAHRHVSAGVGLTAYRIVQEGLTNVRRHAGPVPTVVTVTYDDRQVGISVHNEPARALAVATGSSDASGDGPPQAAAAGGGHGLVGVRERVAMCGGTFSAGATPEQGFRVEARLPVVSG
jgi:signal transduction histidine kinase